MKDKRVSPMTHLATMQIDKSGEQLHELFATEPCRGDDEYGFEASLASSRHIGAKMSVEQVAERIWRRWS